MTVRKHFFLSEEKYERVILRRKVRCLSFDPFCQTCGREVEWLTLPEVAALTGNSADELKRRIVSGEFDFQITNDNRFLICAESIFGPSKKNRTLKKD